MTDTFSEAAYAVYDSSAGGAVDATLRAEDLADLLLDRIRIEAPWLTTQAEEVHRAALAAHDAARTECLTAIEAGLRAGTPVNA